MDEILHACFDQGTLCKIVEGECTDFLVATLKPDVTSEDFTTELEISLKSAKLSEELVFSASFENPSKFIIIRNSGSKVNVYCT